MSENNPKFWTLTYDMFKKDVKKLEDNLIILVHWVLLKNDFQMLGHTNKGSDSKIDENEEATDNLPPNWSRDTTYKFRYTRNKQLFLLNGIKTGDILIINFYNVMTKKVSSTSFGEMSVIVQTMNDMVHNDDDKIRFNAVVGLLEKDLIGSLELDSENKKVASTQTVPLESNQTNIGVHPLSSINRRIAMRSSVSQSYGRPDLDPLGAGYNGGMIFDPLRRPSRPRIGSLLPRNPWARYDPTIPPGIRDDYCSPDMRGPFPDHMRPPDFDDDMYM